MSNLPTREALIKAGYPYGKAADGIPMGDEKAEYLRTSPDYITYIPHADDGTDRDNEHFQVLKVKSGKKLYALWTQSSVEGKGNNHLVYAFSDDYVHWTEPKVLSGAIQNGSKAPASWGFPIMSASGRIYVFYTPGGYNGDWNIMCTYSDDEGETYAPETKLPLPANRMGYWIVWQIPTRISDGTYLAGCTIWYGDEKPGTNWCHKESVSQLLAFENIDDDPDPKDIVISWRNEKPICVPDPMFPDISVAQEPAIIELPDGRIWVQVRTMCDSPYFTVSADGGRTFTEPEPLRFKDGSPLLHPLSPAPIYEYAKGKYFILVHQNPGVRLGFDHHELRWIMNVSNFIRNPNYLCKAEFDAAAEQPLSISEPIKIIDSGDIAVGPKCTAESGTYTSFTRCDNKAVLWYPDRKFYLLGKDLTRYGIIPENTDRR